MYGSSKRSSEGCSGSSRAALFSSQGQSMTADAILDSEFIGQISRASKTSLSVDWFRLLADLKRVGVSSYQIQRKIDVAQSTVLRWAGGSEPRHVDGEMLIAIWCEKTGKRRNELPRVYSHYRN